jgi:hypothetical protein
MKKILSIIAFILLFSTAVFSMSRSKDLHEATGFIRWYGNAPVEYAGFETVDGKLYSLEAAEGASFSLKDITKLQGHLIHLEGRVKKTEGPAFQELKDGTFIVEKYEDLNPELSDSVELKQLN